MSSKQDPEIHLSFLTEQRMGTLINIRNTLVTKIKRFCTFDAESLQFYFLNSLKIPNGKKVKI